MFDTNPVRQAHNCDQDVGSGREADDKMQIKNESAAEPPLLVNEPVEKSASGIPSLHWILTYINHFFLCKRRLLK